jgi:hypothetical protein
MIPSDSSSLVGSLLGRLDWLSNIGANALRAVVLVQVVAVVAFWAVVARSWDLGGIVAVALALIPAALLWWYARALDRAVSRTRIELSVTELIAKTAASLGEVAEARRLRFGLIRAGWRALTSVRELRDDLDRLGLDLAAWATVANPGSLFVAAVSIAACGALTTLAALGIALKLLL